MAKKATKQAAPVGRPSVYTAELAVRARHYVEDAHDEVTYSRGHKSIIYRDVNIPTIEGLAYELKVHRDTLYDWEKIHPEFSDILGDLRAKQAVELINKGLSGAFNPTIAKVLLTKHGYREGQELTGADGANLFDDKDAKAKGKSAIANFFNRGNSGQGE